MKKIIIGLILSGFTVSACIGEIVGTADNPSGSPVILDIGKDKKGSSFSVKIDFKNSFNIKVNTDGTPAKTAADVKKFQVYLIKNGTTTAYPSNGDPLSTGSTGDFVAGPLEVTYTGSGSKLITFANVADSVGKAYYAAIRAQTTGGVDLLKANTSWGAATTLISNKLAVSSGAGIVVDADLKALPVTALSVTGLLEDGVGANLEAVIAPSNGSPILPSPSGL